MWWYKDTKPTCVACQNMMVFLTEATCGWAAFLMRHWKTEKLWLLRLGHLADSFSKMNKVSLSLQGKQLTVSVANDTIWVFKQKLKFWKICLPQWARQLPNTYRYLGGKAGSVINKCDFAFWILCNAMCQYLEDLHNSATQYFLNDQCTILKNHALGWKPEVQRRLTDFNLKD